MNEHELLERINILEYHQKLLLKLLNDPKLELYKLIIENGITEQEAGQFYFLCDNMNKKFEEQKAEGYVYFHPLFHELSSSLPPKLNIKDVIKACITQRIYLALFQELNKYL
ncbi:YhaI family protein [Bacillus sp. sid0103]|uniref:DUF1878 family protein n=1 Tax=Bacillus sp. sid0103 TaxID=2856337 RepID=UPI001C468DD6|nr:DUF1878 family protein [Bacillus sp. sid0103]MBV7508188.1 YhaI family protein [Bacillus sp. sid0103]